ncbi:MAG: MerR family transcriptional regulator [Bacteroidia bacterium]|nr:MerR family transcriptional regulator [Bacteroidia bacterium]
MRQLSVKQLARMAGVSVRTLHVYDQKGLLKPANRTEARYRLYGEKELLRLQQILFYKELDFSLQDISDIINEPDFDVVKALESHRIALLDRKKRLNTLLNTIDATIFHLKNNKTMNYESLYEGLPKEKAAAYRAEALEKWGKDAIENSENQLLKMAKPDFEALKNRQIQLGQQLFALHTSALPDAPEVQVLIKLHYELMEQFWAKKPTAEAYIGLGEMYVSDERYTLQNDVPQPAYAQFMSQAMRHFAETQLDKVS